MMRRSVVWMAFWMLILCACNTLKYVPEPSMLLKEVHVDAPKYVPGREELKNYVLQEPNERFLGLINLNLFWYNLSGPDTTRWVNRTLRNIGEAPVLFDPILAERSRQSLTRYMRNEGYHNAQVDTTLRVDKRRVELSYNITPNEPYRIRQYTYLANTDSISRWIVDGLNQTLIRPEMRLSSPDLNSERARLTRYLQRNGYFVANNNMFAFEVDSTLGNHRADVELLVQPKHYARHRIRNVIFMLDVPMSSFVRNPNNASDTQDRGMAFALADYDTLRIGSYEVIYRGKPFVSPDALMHNCLIEPGSFYDVQDVERTSSRMNQLELMKYVNIRFLEPYAEDTSALVRALDCYVVLTPNLKQNFSVEVEGTNTAGDLGVAGNVGYTHLNVFRGAEVLQLKFRGAYEALSTNFMSDYTELGGELALTFPDFKMPFLKETFKRKVDARTEVAISFQDMSRPEFNRKVASSSVRYNWGSPTLRQTIDLVDLSYIYMPWVDSTFQANYLTNNSYLKYAYEDHFILRAGYSFSYSSTPLGSNKRSYYTLRGSFESAGNLLNALYAVGGIDKIDGFYRIGKINFAQYLKGEFEYASSRVLDSRNRIAYRAGLGIAYPYGNSRILPFEKRFFSGGANSVRGWSVRTLGPGSYKRQSQRIDFMNQSGDIKLDLGVEYRSVLFWKLESALFADMGNIWTIRDYVGQEGGQFQPLSFYEDLAASVGLGLRANFDFFLLRLDMGMKMHDPSKIGLERWRFRNPKRSEDFAVHFAIGYPF